MAPSGIKLKKFDLDQSLLGGSGPLGGEKKIYNNFKNPKLISLPPGYSRREANEAMMGIALSRMGESRRRIEGCANLFKPFSQTVFNNESTAKYTSSSIDPYFQPNEAKSVGVYAQTYAKIYEVNQCAETLPNNNFPNYLACYRYQDSAGEVPEFVNPEKAQGAINFIQSYRKDIRQAAEILASHHQLQPHLVESLLIVGAFLEIMRMNKIDLIQDASASSWAECEISKNFRSVLGNDYPPFYKRWGWEWASDIDNPYVPGRYIQAGIKSGIQAKYGRIPVANQGFGPLQLIVGNAMEAGRNSAVLEHYRGFLDAADFADEKSTLRAILDLPYDKNGQRYAKMFYVKALMLDHVLTKLEPLFPKNLDQIPYSRKIPDRTTELQWRKLMTAQEVTAYPERQGKAIDQFCSYIYVTDMSSYLVVLDEVLNLGHPLGIKIRHDKWGEFSFESAIPEEICEEKKDQF